jgi:hypothetical protein
MAVMAEFGSQAVTGVVAPSVGEAHLRDAWPSVASMPAKAALARRCYQSVLFAPIGWLVLAPFLVKRLIGFLPGCSGLVTRYRLTNRRLMVCKGYQAKPVQEVALDQIKDVRLQTDEVSDYFFAGTLEVIGPGGQLVMTLPGVREAESFRHSILQAAAAWGPFQKR